MRNFRVIYAIDVVADDPQSAAQQAWSVIRGQMHDPDAFPPIFEVHAADDPLAPGVLVEVVSPQTA